LLTGIDNADVAVAGNVNLHPRAGVPDSILADHDSYVEVARIGSWNGKGGRNGAKNVTAAGPKRQRQHYQDGRSRIGAVLHP
jgi:hypothetical protein